MKCIYHATAVKTYITVVINDSLVNTHNLGSMLFLTRNNTEESQEPHTFTLLEPHADAEHRPEVTALATRASDA